jgi:hypothetical protein
MPTVDARYTSGKDCLIELSDRAAIALRSSSIDDVLGKLALEL